MKSFSLVATFGEFSNLAYTMKCSDALYSLSRAVYLAHSSGSCACGRITGCSNASVSVHLLQEPDRSQFAYLRGLADDPCTEIDYLVERGFLSQRQKGLISIDMVKTFTQSGLFARMLDAKWLRRELKFTVLARAGDLLPGLTGGQQEEKLLLQGVIDCIYEGDEGIVLVDYKTDRVRQAQVLVQRYQSQLQLYALALAEITRKPVKERYVALLRTGAAVPV